MRLEGLRVTAESSVGGECGGVKDVVYRNATMSKQKPISDKSVQAVKSRSSKDSINPYLEQEFSQETTR
jgi:hypothetical protein